MSGADVVPVRIETMVAAGHRWQEADRSPACQDNFEHFLGVQNSDEHYPRRAWTWVTPNTAERLDLIMGPYYRAVIKAYLIRKQDD